MAFDGITVNALVHELNNTLSGGRLNKIAQPEKDELFLTIKTPDGQRRLLLSVNASLPLVYLTDKNKPSPLTAPNFCMLLRKHLNNGRIVSVSQPGLERIIDFTIEHLDEMGDLCTKHLIVELMGKHSNIIFVDDNNKIIDSIKRVNAGLSSVREVLPGLPYFIPNTSEKLNPLTASVTDVTETVFSQNIPVYKALYTSYTGISPIVSESLCYDGGIDSSVPASMLDSNEKLHLSSLFVNLMDDIKNGIFSPVIYYENSVPKEFFVYPADMYHDLDSCKFDSVSSMLETYYSGKNAVSRMHQRSSDLRQIINIALERNYKKYQLQEKQLFDTDKRDLYRVYGELINTYGYSIEKNAASLEALNYYTGENITIPLEPNLSPKENSIKYFAKYNKLKRTYDALSGLIQETKKEIEHLESIKTAVDIATSYDDLIQIKEELTAYGFIKNKNTGKKAVREHSKSKPLHYISSDGFDIFVGKNNYQNEELTFKTATGNDWWFHAKNMPGSHVIVKSGNKTLPDKTFEEAAALAAYYSNGRSQEKVEIDYIEKKHVKKVNGAAPGFVIYHTNYSMVISPDISGIALAE
ncbi:MAG: NFACT family protein [Butyrivibrio sp.]